MTTNSPTQQVPRFTTRFLFLLTGVVAACLVPWVHWGREGLYVSFVIAVVLLLLIEKRYVFAGVTFFAFGLLLYLFLPTLGAARAPLHALRCRMNLEEIVQAIDSYYASNGHYPPPFTTDERGKPLHSWRVLILPYLHEETLYKQIDLTKPWNHPKNRALASQMPEVYKCPIFISRTSAQDMTTAYVAIVGSHTVWPRSGKRTIKDITDGLAKTLLVIESERHRLHWMSIADPGIEMIGPITGDGETPVGHGPHCGESWAAFGNGYVRRFDFKYKFDSFLDMITIDDGKNPMLPD